ncbi:t-SNARE [Syncephalis pseudoplumigaleata]|uniref:t-SNARE n=1 Tax=Syncephalis pseudoplumigaleata TaxID=1712513 RepID=A0A4P9YXU5_9FUNG|nr:t-SNARE [Syncephalis pseudoplumigaleata]|eukprot:RKP24887.1 t-SNARE [Syncephalis pseudoplumigaleata]
MAHHYQDQHNAYELADELERLCDLLRQRTSGLAAIHARLEQALSEQDALAAQHELERYNEDARAISRQIVDQLKAFRLETARMPANDSIRQMRANRCTTISRRLTDALNEQRERMRLHDNAMRAKFSRQYRALHPGASEGEIEQQIDNQPGGIFATELLMGARAEQGRQTLDAVKARQQEVEKIVRSVNELHQMFQELQTLLELQDETLLAIEGNAEQTKVRVEQAAKHVDTAVDSARAARKKRWCLFLFFILLIIVIVVVVVLVVKQK